MHNEKVEEEGGRSEIKTKENTKEKEEEYGTTQTQRRQQNKRK